MRVRIALGPIGLFACAIVLSMPAMAGNGSSDDANKFVFQAGLAGYLIYRLFSSRKSNNSNKPTNQTKLTKDKQLATFNPITQLKRIYPDKPSLLTLTKNVIADPRTTVVAISIAFVSFFFVHAYDPRGGIIWNIMNDQIYLTDECYIPTSPPTDFDKLMDNSSTCGKTVLIYSF